MQCRACRRFNCKKVMEMSYVAPEDGKTLYDYFNDCTQLEASYKDDLPKILCMNCIKNLRQAYNFREEARRSDQELKKSLTLPKDEPELIFNEQSEMIEENDASTIDLLIVNPKLESDSCYPDHSEILKDSLPTLKNVSAVIFHSEESEDFQNIDVASTTDPLSPSAHRGRNLTAECTMIDDSNVQLDTIKEELIVEPLVNISEESSDASIYDAREESGQNNVLRKRRTTTYTCSFCVYKTRTQLELKRHIFELHKDKIICHKCCKFFELPRDIQLHENLVHRTDYHMPCPWCNNSETLPKDELVLHIKTKHNSTYLKYFPRLRMPPRCEDDPFQCERCQMFFLTASELIDHLQEHRKHCSLCSMTFKRHDYYKLHIERVHNKSLDSSETSLTRNMEIGIQMTCSLCSKQFKSSKNFQQHMKNKHNENKSNSEKDINGKDHQSAAFDIKGQTHTDDVVDTITTMISETSTAVQAVGQQENDELVECKYCHRNIPASRIEYHQKRHAYRLRKQRNYMCSYCPREFKSESSVKLHEKHIHLLEKQIKKECPVCKKHINAKYLKNHLENVHTSERKFICDICGDRFKSRSLLFYHKQLHINRRFSCTVCNKKFIRDCELKVHMRMHTGEEPYACHLCDKRFKLKGRLNYHLQQHAGIKRKCNVCGKEFNHIKQLKIHSYKHTGMPYRCSVCNYGCAPRDVFRKHLLRVHNMTMTTEEYNAMFKANTGRNPFVQTLDELQSNTKDVKIE